jgi:hypothetical protein
MPKKLDPFIATTGPRLLSTNNSPFRPELTPVVEK